MIESGSLKDPANINCPLKPNAVKRTKTKGWPGLHSGLHQGFMIYMIALILYSSAFFIWISIASQLKSNIKTILSNNQTIQQQQKLNGPVAVTDTTSSTSETPSYVITGRKITKILNEFFDVSTFQFVLESYLKPNG